MKNVARALIPVLLVLVIVSAYRAYIDDKPFLLAFDSLVTIIISEFWKVISTPTVFIATILGVVLLTYRKQASPFISALREISIGNISAKLEPERIGIASQLQTAIEERKPEDAGSATVSLSTKEDVVAHLTQDFYLYLLKVVNRPLSFNEHLDLIARELPPGTAWSNGPEEKSDDLLRRVKDIARTASAGGYLLALFQFSGVILRFLKGDGDNFIIQVDSDVLDLIRKRVGKGPSGE